MRVSTVVMPPPPAPPGRPCRSRWRGSSLWCLLSWCGAVEKQVDDTAREPFVDGRAGDEQAVEERAGEDVERELEIEVSPEVAPLDAPRENRRQARAPGGEEPLANRARELGIAVHGG